MLLLLTAATSLKHASIDDFYFTHRLELLQEVLKQLSSEEDQFRSVRLVHLERCRKCMEPHAVDYFGHIFRPFNLVHLLNDIVGNDLLVYGTLCILCVIV